MFFSSKDFDKILIRMHRLYPTCFLPALCKTHEVCHRLNKTFSVLFLQSVLRAFYWISLLQSKTKFFSDTKFSNKPLLNFLPRSDSFFKIFAYFNHYQKFLISGSYRSSWRLCNYSISPPNLSVISPTRNVCCLKTFLYVRRDRLRTCGWKN